MANEEVEVERQIVRTIIAGNSDSLRPNSDEPITIRGHNIVVGCHNERGSVYQVWEWHVHVMTYDEMNAKEEGKVDKDTVRIIFSGNFSTRKNLSKWGQTRSIEKIWKCLPAISILQSAAKKCLNKILMRKSPTST
ncbi:hypothetical protein CKAN_02015300 [Cinnamomum micranthum f. kanehirae]|uniref:Uncharacterized protein n=1 Tax=Cinnamomum micranthum f. kanehirae TaxID=337451 RepID=A0A443PJR5_9MAGN|nr:hypothetical protein CKAN_02015300 [Cinnamomum micranthum f. kanehirae]